MSTLSTHRRTLSLQSFTGSTFGAIDGVRWMRVPTPAVAAPALLEVLADVVADGHGRIAYASPAVRSLLGHEPESSAAVR
jgi:hypothetical protein